MLWAVLRLEAGQGPERKHVPERGVRDADGSVEHPGYVFLGPVTRSKLAFQQQLHSVLDGGGFLAVCGHECEEGPGSLNHRAT